MRKSYFVFIFMVAFMATAYAGLDIPRFGTWTQNDYHVLGDYQARNSDEKKIIQLLLTFENASNSHDSEGVFAVYSKKAMIHAIGSAGSSVLVKKKDYYPILKEKLGKWKLYQFTLCLLSPDSIHFQGDSVTAQVPYLLYSLSQEYCEKGRYRFNCSKEADNNWRISRSIKVIMDLHYNP